jgi:hypothetical protein
VLCTIVAEFLVICDPVDRLMRVTKHYDYHDYDVYDVYEVYGIYEERVQDSAENPYRFPCADGRNRRGEA